MSIVPSTPTKKKTLCLAAAPTRRSPRKPLTVQLMLGPANDVHGNDLLMDIMLQNCSWASLVVLANVNMRFRWMVYRLVRARIRRFLFKFMNNTAGVPFFELLRKTRAAVVGGIVRCVMSPHVNFYDEVYPNQLEIIVPNDDGNKLMSPFICWQFFASGQGYLWQKQSSGYALSDMTESYPKWMCFCHPISGYKHGFLFPPYPRRLYCLYPKLLAASENVHMIPIRSYAIDRDPLEPFTFGLRTYESTAFWSGRPCGEACPALWRTAENLKSVGIARWGGWWGKEDLGDTAPKESTNPDSDVESDFDPDRFEHLECMWKIAGLCRNVACPNRGRGGRL
ncbi:hypothetical protein BDZ97DRAFT_1930583 [Flammula alnicola]|nr:hypothetical protein BDZ97DRAFT_1930583 [Flammula alnicola]